MTRKNSPRMDEAIDHVIRAIKRDGSYIVTGSMECALLRQMANDRTIQVLEQSTVYDGRLAMHLPRIRYGF